MSLPRTAHPQINEVIKLYEKEEIQFRKIHRLIDLAEVLIKTHTAYILSDYFKINKMSDEVKGMLAALMIIPKLGEWQRIGRTISVELDKIYKEAENNEELPALFIDNFLSKYKWWEVKLNKYNIIKLRNDYAHGATPSEDECKKDVIKYEEHIKFMLNSKQMSWLQNTSIITFESIEGNLIPIELEEDENSFIDDELVSKILCQNKNIVPMHPYLVDLNGSLLDLFPILYIKEPEKAKRKSLIFFNDLKDKDNETISYLNYPFADHIKEKDIYTDFMSVIRIDEWKNGVTDEFQQKINELTEIFIGREKDLELIDNFIIRNSSGFLFITGNAGMGKSALIAMAIKSIQEKQKSDIKYIEYFIKRGSCNPRDFLLYMNSKLEAIARTGLVIDERDLRNNFYNRLKQASKKLKGKKIVIFIDGLDEGIKEEVSLLNDMIHDVYPGILVVYSTRFNQAANDFYNNLPLGYKEQHMISGISEEDIRALLYEVTNKYELTMDYIEEVKDKSAGNPLYVKLLCMAIEKGELKANDTIRLTSDYNDFYKGILDRLEKEDCSESILKALYLITTSKDYVSKKFIELVFNHMSVNESAIKSGKAIGQLREIIATNPKNYNEYQLFHESLREYIQANKKDELNEAVQNLASFCSTWKELRNYEFPIKAYPLKYYSSHLREIKDLETLNKLTEDSEYINEQINITEQFAYSYTLMEDAMRLAAENSDIKAAVNIAVNTGKLHIKMSGEIVKIIEDLKTVSLKNLDKSLDKIRLFTGREQFVLYINLIYGILQNTEDNKNKKLAVEKAVTELDDNLDDDCEVINWCKFISPRFMLEIVKGIQALDIDTMAIIKRGKLVVEEQKNYDLQLKLIKSVDLNKKTDCRSLLYMSKIYEGEYMANYLCSFAEALMLNKDERAARYVLTFALEQIDSYKVANWPGIENHRPIWQSMCILKEAELGFLDESLSLVKRVKYKEDIALLYSSLALMQSEKNAHNAAEVYQLAIDYCEPLKATREKAISYRNLSRAALNLGKEKEGKELEKLCFNTIDLIEEYVDIVFALTELACQYSKEKNIEKVKICLGKLDKSSYGYGDFEALVKQLTIDGYMNYAFELAEECSDMFIYADVIEAIAIGIAEVDDYDKAFEIADRIKYVESFGEKGYEVDFKQEAFNKILKVMAQRGYIENLKKYLQKLGNKNKIDFIINTLLSHGYLYDAIEIMAVEGIQVEDNINISKALSLSYSMEGNLDLALESINRSLKKVDKLKFSVYEHRNYLELLLLKANYYFRKGKVKEAKGCLEYAKDYSNEIRLRADEQSSLRISCLIYFCRDLNIEEPVSLLLEKIERALQKSKYREYEERINSTIESQYSGPIKAGDIEAVKNYVKNKVEGQKEFRYVEAMEFASVSTIVFEKDYKDEAKEIMDEALKIAFDKEEHFAETAMSHIYAELCHQGKYEEAEKVYLALINNINGELKELAFQYVGGITQDIMTTGNYKKALGVIYDLDLNANDAGIVIEHICDYLDKNNFGAIVDFLNANNRSGGEATILLFKELINSVYKFEENTMEWLLKLLPFSISSKEFTAQALYVTAVYLRHTSTMEKAEKTALLRDISGIIDIDYLMEEKDDCKYTFDNYLEWVRGIEDKEKQAAVLALINKVILFEITKEQFNSEVKNIL